MPRNNRKNTSSIKISSLAREVKAIERRLQGGRRKPARAAPPRAAPAARHVDKYAMALMHPFSAEAEGARVPDPYAQPTVTYRVKRVVSLTSSAAGALDFAVCPHPDLGAYQFTGTASGLTTRTTGNQPAGITCYSLTGLSSVYRSHRIVSYGLRLKSNTTFSNTNGRVYVARVPCSMEVPGDSVTVGTTLSEFADMLAAPIDGTGLTSSIIGLPKAQEFTLSELHMEGGLEMVTHPVGPSALDFLDSQYTSKETAGSRAQAGYWSTRGWQQFLIAGDGLPASAQILTVEIILHLEGTPLLNPSSALTPSGIVAAVGSSTSVHQVHSALASMPAVQKLREKAEDEVRHRAAGVLQRFGRAALSRAKKSAAERGGLAADLLGVALA